MANVSRTPVKVADVTATPRVGVNGPGSASAPSVPPSPSSGGAQPRRPDRKLLLEDVVQLMKCDGLVAADQADEFLKTTRYHRDQHPLVLIANLKLRSRQPPHRLLHIEWLTEWL